jgi:hypothetical protein
MCPESQVYHKAFRNKAVESTGSCRTFPPVGPIKTHDFARYPPQGKVALMFDEDEAGWKAREDALSRLSGRVHVKVIGLGEEGRQPDSLSDEELTRVIQGL